MAYLPSRPLDEEGQGGQPKLGGQASFVQAGSGATGASPAPGTGQGTGFVDLRRYLEANAPKTGALADKVGGGIEEKAGETESAINTGVGEFKSAATEQNKMDPDWVSQSLMNPQETVGSPEDFERFTALREGTFRGDTAMDPSKFVGNVQEAEDYGNLTQTPGGMEELMAGFSADPTKGKSALNTALLQQSDPAQARLAQARERTSGLQDYLNQSVTGTQDFTGGLQNQLTDFAPQVGQMSQDEASRFKDAVTQNYNTRNTAAIGTINDKVAAENARISDLMAQSTLGDNYYNNFVLPTRQSSGLTRDQSASVEDYARDAALDKLIGSESGVLTNENAAQGGTWDSALDMYLNSPDFNEFGVLYGGDFGSDRQGNPIEPSFWIDADGNIQSSAPGGGGEFQPGTGNRYDDYGWGVRRSDVVPGYL